MLYIETIHLFGLVFIDHAEVQRSQRSAAACGKSPWRLTVIMGWQEFITPTTRQMHVGASCGSNYPLHHDLLFQIKSSLLHFKRSNVSKIERPSDKHPHSRCVSCLFTCVIFSCLCTTSAPLCHALNEAVTVGRVFVFPPLQAERAREEICAQHNAKIFASDGPQRLSFTNENVILL